MRSLCWLMNLVSSWKQNNWLARKLTVLIKFLKAIVAVLLVFELRWAILKCYINGVTCAGCFNSTFSIQCLILPVYNSLQYLYILSSATELKLSQRQLVHAASNTREHRGVCQSIYVTLILVAIFFFIWKKHLPNFERVFSKGAGGGGMSNGKSKVG